MAQWPRMSSASRVGVTWCQSRLVTAYTVSRLLTSVPVWLAGAGDPDGEPGVREADPGGDGGDLQGAPLAPAVGLVLAVGCRRHVAPGQPGQLGMQGGLVAFDDEHVGAAVPVQVPGVTLLGVQCVRGDHDVLEVDPVQYR